MSKKKQEGLNENEEIQAQTEAQVESRNKVLNKKGEEFDKAIRALSNRDSQTVKAIARKIYGDNINVTIYKNGDVSVTTETGDLITVS
jgi:hypothetical protein